MMGWRERGTARCRTSSRMVSNGKLTLWQETLNSTAAISPGFAFWLTPTARTMEVPILALYDGVTELRWVTVDRYWRADLDDNFIIDNADRYSSH